MAALLAMLLSLFGGASAHVAPNPNATWICDGMRCWGVKALPAQPAQPAVAGPQFPPRCGCVKK